MEKSNWINLIASSFLILAGAGLWLFAWLDAYEDIGWILITGGALIIYGIMRMVISNQATKQE